MTNTMERPKELTAILTSLAPWISVQNGANAVSFYKSAFGAIEAYRLQDPEGGLVVRFSIDGAEFWVSGGAGKDDVINLQQENPVRMILTVANPEAFFARALQAGASEIFPVSEEHGWRLGRLADPFGNHWEIGHPLNK